MRIKKEVMEKIKTLAEADPNAKCVIHTRMKADFDTAEGRLAFGELIKALFDLDCEVTINPIDKKSSTPA
jgi:hypothetical protein